MESDINFSDLKHVWLSLRDLQMIIDNPAKYKQQIDELYTHNGIYMIRNIRTNERYIGETHASFYERWEHYEKRLTGKWNGTNANLEPKFLKTSLLLIQKILMISILLFSKLLTERAKSLIGIKKSFGGLT